MEDIKIRLTEDVAKKIIGNKESAFQYLTNLNEIDNFGKINKNIDTPTLWKTIVNTWNYENSKTIIRNIFCKTPKFQNGKDADNAMNILLEEWNALQLGDVNWPFPQGDFDGFVQRINAENSSGFEKDEKVKQAAVKYRRIKEINTVRNDFIETLIFEKNENITPTLNHRRGVDFFINGISFDQKVAKSPTNQFKKDFGENWRQKAIDNPELVAQYLYTFQDEGRFGADPRLLVVYIDEDVTVEQIRNIIKTTDLTNHTTIDFTYKHKIQ
jgi:hypothetical protein